MDIRGFRLTAVPEDFHDDPYRYYAALREQDPVHELEPGSYFLSRYDDVVAVYRDPAASSDKKIEFEPKFGASPLYEHHTTNLIGSGLWLLLKNPTEMARLRKEAHLLPSAIEEMLRYEGPIQLNNRRLLKPLEIGGKRLPTGSLLTLGIGA